MANDYQLVELYCVICHLYDTILVNDAQRLSNNFRPKFTDEECIAIYLWGIINWKFKLNDVYEFAKNYYGGWFPELPGYKAFNKRVCFLSDAIKTLANILLSTLPGNNSEAAHLLDSMPIIVAKQNRSGKAKTASELCDKGYCDYKYLP